MLGILLSDFINLAQVHNFTVSAQDMFYHLSLKKFLYLFLSGRFRQILFNCIIVLSGHCSIFVKCTENIEI